MSEAKPIGESGRNGGGLLVLAAAFCFLAVAGRMDSMAAADGVDFFHFWAVPVAVEMGFAEDVYDDAGRERLGREFAGLSGHGANDAFVRVARIRTRWDTTATPAMYAVLSPLRHVPYDRSLALFRHGCIAAGLVAIVLIARFALGQSLVFALLAAGVLFRFSSAVASDLDVGNVNLLQLLVLAILLRLSDRPARGCWQPALQGGFLGAAVAIKPNLHGVVLLLGALYLARREYAALWRWVGGLAFGGAVMFALGSWFFGGVSAWTEWFAAIRGTIAEGYPSGSGNYSIVHVLYERTGLDVSMYALFGFLAMFAVFFVAFRNAGETVRWERFAICAGAAFPLLTWQLAWAHYYVLAIPLLLLVVSSAGANAVRAVLAGVAILLFIGWPQLAGLLRAAGGSGAWVAACALSVALMLGLAAWDVAHERFGLRDPPDGCS